MKEAEQIIELLHDYLKNARQADRQLCLELGVDNIIQASPPYIPRREQGIRRRRPGADPWKLYEFAKAQAETRTITAARNFLTMNRDVGCIWRWRTGSR